MCSFAWGGNRCREGIIPLKKCSSSERDAGGGGGGGGGGEGGAGAGGGGLLNTSRRHFSICPSLSLPPTLPLFCVLLTVSNGNKIFGSDNRQKYIQHERL